MTKVQIGIIGDYRDGFAPHSITNDFFAHAAAVSGAEVASSWLETDRVTDKALQQFHALWIAPGSPYRSLEGALAAVSFAREGGVPLGGACAGFQHVVLEYARNVLGFWDAAHEEYDPPAASRLVLHRLACAVAGKELPIQLAPDSLVAKTYARTSIAERYYCSFGFNPEYRYHLRDLRISGWDAAGEARVVELSGHPYYLATLFVPKSMPASPHPLASAFLKAAIQQATAHEAV